MKARTRTLRPIYMALIAAGFGLLPFGSQAQGLSASEAQARYKEDIQRCESLTDPEAQRTCRREAGAALQEARRDRLVRGDSDMRANTLARCQRLPMEQRADCERLMSDSSAVEHGSVSGGGVIRELTITVPADSATDTGTYSQPAPSGTYTQPAPMPNQYGTQPAPGSGGYSEPAPGAGSYGTQAVPAR